MKYVLLILVALNISELNAQLPMPCVNYYSTNFGELIQFHGWKSTTCLNINTEQQPGETPLSLSDNHSREFVVTEAVIEPGFSYTPGEDPSAQFSIVLGGNREDMSAVWFEPAHYDPQIYEKIEWGFQLPAEVEAAIDNWIFNDQNPTATPLTPALNPFDPDQIDLHAIIDYTTINGGVYFSQPVNGFFYRDYDRITAYHNPDMEDMSDVNDWYWRENQTDYRFRIRWASDAEAQHSVRVVLNVPSMGNWETESFEFRSLWNDPRNSFISITNNQHYFKTADGHVYFPVGLNINGETFGCECAENVEDIWTNDLAPMDCEACYGAYDPAGDPNDDPCCGLRFNKRTGSHYIIQDTVGNASPVQNYTLAPAAYEKLDRVLNTLKDKGANSFRTLFDPGVYDIEFEKLNNYYDRQFQAWEYDNLVEKSEELDLRIEWNMMIHYALSYSPYGADRFDWNNINNEGNYENWSNGTDGFCYWRELNLETPLDFLTNPLAISNYQKKLRYMIARWGYSKNIFVMELMSEINGIGVDSKIPEDVRTKPYDTNPTVVRPAVAAWHHEMARYIKEELHHSRHLIAADYTGTGPMDLNPGYENAPCIYEFFDDSWQSDLVDVIAWNNYSDALNRWEKMADHEYYNSDQTNGLLCNGIFVVDSYQELWKPVINPEVGMNACPSLDHTGFVKDLLVGPFSGHASSGMSWDEWGSSQYWNYMGEVVEYLNLHVLSDVDLGNGTWLPSHSYSEERASADNCIFAEAIYLRNSNTNATKFSGIIFNRSWNHESLWNCNSAQFSGNNSHLAKINIIGEVTDEFSIENAGFHQFTIRYFDPYTKAQVDQVNKHSNLSGGLKLEHFPLMIDGTNNHHPFYFFEAFVEGSEFYDAPLQPESKFNSEEEKSSPASAPAIYLSTSQLISIPDKIEFKAFPNPADDQITLISNQDLQGNEVIIYSTSGEMIQKRLIQTATEVIDINALSSGAYFIVCQKLGLRTSFTKL